MSSLVSASLALLAIVLAGLALVLATVANRRWVAAGGSRRIRDPQPAVRVTGDTDRVDEFGHLSDAAQKALAALTGELAAVAAQVEAVTAQVETVTGQADAMTGQVEKATGQVGAVAAQVEAVTAQVETVTGQADAMTGQVEKVTGQVGAVAGQLEAVTGQVEAVTGQVGTVAGQLEAVAGQVEAVTGQVEVVTGQVDVLSAQEHARAQAEAARAATPPTDPTALRHVALVRYDAFADVGGRLSYSVALLDDTGSGLVLTTLANKAEVRTYVRTLSAGQADGTLTAEEQQAIGAAVGRF